MSVQTDSPDIQGLVAEQLVRNLQEDGRFAGHLWAKEGRCRVYVRADNKDYGYLAVGRDGMVYPALSRLVGNITRAAGVSQ